MKSNISRRDFLKLASISMLAPFLPAIENTNSAQLGSISSASGYQAGGSALPNVIVIIFDALSALNLDTYGYPRSTGTNLDRFAQRSIVYHNHHSAGNFTTPSTASLLTGVYPWTHRAFTYGNRVNQQLAPNNLFQMLSDVYFQTAYTQNLFADALLRQFSNSLDRYVPLSSFSLVGSTIYDRFSQKDSYYALSSFEDFLFDQEEVSGSLFMSALNDVLSAINLRIADNEYGDQYPLGFPKQPKTKLAFTIDQVINGVTHAMQSWEQPFLSYLHFIPPHAPYRPHRDYQGLFNDGWAPVEKPIHPLSKGTPQEKLDGARLVYDQYIANLDAEVGRLFDYLERSGLMDNSYVIFTSDHGELFERGMQGHSTRMVFEPVLRVPLFISVPGSTERRDIFAPTNTVDLLPTLLKIAGKPIPDWADGAVLPGIGGDLPVDRATYTVEAKSNSTFEPLKKASIALVQDQYKLIRYLGYSGAPEGYEFYDLQNDPEELSNLYSSHPVASEMQYVLDKKIKQVNQPFKKT